MSGMTVAIVGFAAMLGLIVIRAPIGLAMLIVGAAGYMTLSSPMAFFGYMKTNAYHQFANYTLSVIPLFILMGRSPSGQASRRRCSNRRKAGSAASAADTRWR